MELAQIYRPIKKELRDMEDVLESALKRSGNKSILKLNSFLLESPGKRIRPALLILCAKAVRGSSPAAVTGKDVQGTLKGAGGNEQLIKIASAVELIHMASLVHDDVIDHSSLRHNKPTINHKWGNDVSIALGDYLYAVAFELISTCGGRQEILHCISSATKAMCEGELIQVCERDNLDLLKERYVVIVKKKTAALFAASCQAGALIFSSAGNDLPRALKGYGLNFGIAFQITDDYLDIAGVQEAIGKPPGQDIRAGEITLPVLNLWKSLSPTERKELELLLISKRSKEAVKRIRERLFSSGAAAKTKETASSFIDLAKQEIDILSCSPYKESLLKLADFIIENSFNGLLK